jgi:hypothetical protein
MLLSKLNSWRHIPQPWNSSYETDSSIRSVVVAALATFRRKIPEAGETALRRRIQGGLKNN